MLLGHGYIMNGGLEHFVDLSEEEQGDSINGFRFFSFDEVAGLILSFFRSSMFGDGLGRFGTALGRVHY